MPAQYQSTYGIVKEPEAPRQYQTVTALLNTSSVFVRPPGSIDNRLNRRGSAARGRIQVDSPGSFF